MKFIITIYISVCISALNAQGTAEYSTVMIGEIVPHIIEKHKFNESGELETYQRELFLPVIENESIDTSRLTNQKVLKPTEAKRLLTLLTENNTEGERFWSDCYIPRDYISFLLDNEIVGFIEICIECSEIRTYGICADWNFNLRQDDYALLQKFMTEIRKE